MNIIIINFITVFIDIRIFIIVIDDNIIKITFVYFLFGWNNLQFVNFTYLLCCFYQSIIFTLGMCLEK